jgi:lipid II:glycine glycyltransferase (peptidoglycan interpeptide bridge formation enzyme)
MHHKTRYNARLASRRGIRLEVLPPTAAYLERFHELLRDTAVRNRFSIHPLEYYAGALRAFGDDAALLGAMTPEGHLAAALIVARFGDEAIYLYGASSTEHRANGAGIAIQVEAMRWARDRGARMYDLWGIPRHDPDCTAESGDRIAGSSGKDWHGLFRFKTGFGGDIVSYPEPMERRYVPLLPSLARRLGLIPG